MARVAARKKRATKKAKETARSATKGKRMQKVKPSSIGTQKKQSTKKPLKSARPKKAALKTRGAGARKSPHKRRESSARMEMESGIMSKGIPSVAEAPPPRLLRDTKGTSAALALLEKAIKLIHQKDYKRAHVELNNLMREHPEEKEILARARSYIQICDREQPAGKKAPMTNDQLYALGVLEHNRGDYQTAISHFSQAIQKHHDADHIYYSMAASLAATGDAEAAIRNLCKAIELNEDNRVYAKNDPDFSSLYSLKEFIDLVGLNNSPANEAD
jgi:tetratricopeptide (TPR) repeat protein